MCEMWVRLVKAKWGQIKVLRIQLSPHDCMCQTKKTKYRMRTEFLFEASVMEMETGGSKPGGCHGDQGRCRKVRRVSW